MRQIAVISEWTPHIYSRQFIDHLQQMETAPGPHLYKDSITKMSKKVYDDKTISRIIEKGTAKEKLNLDKKLPGVSEHSNETLPEQRTATN